MKIRMTTFDVTVQELDALSRHYGKNHRFTRQEFIEWVDRVIHAHLDAMVEEVERGDD